MSERLFSPEHRVGKELLRWWQDLDEHRGDRAELRRAESLLSVMQLPAFHVALVRLRDAGWAEAGDPNQGERLALVIGLAAQVRSAPGAAAQAQLPRLAEAFSEGEKPAVSSLRFRRLLESANEEELFARLRRVLPLVKERVNLLQLSSDAFYWGDAVRKSWIYNYRWPQKAD